MFECNCGKEFKTSTGCDKHKLNCDYATINFNKIYNLGIMIDETNNKIFHIALGKIKKHSKTMNISFEQSKRELQQQEIYKYRKSLWDILQIWEHELLTSEYRTFLIWVWKTYKDVSLLSLRNTLSNTKIIYRFNIENTTQMIEKRISESLIYIHEHGTFSNDFEFVNFIISGNVSMYYVLFNDWLAQKWFGRLDLDLQKELEEHVQIASKTVLERLKKCEFNKLQHLANTSTPSIHAMF